MVFNEKIVTRICSIIWLLYFIYSLFLTIYDITTVRKVDWTNAKNISHSYGGYKATIVTYEFQKNNIQIARKYGYFTQGLTVWSWGIDKKSHYVNLSFFVKKKDYEKVVNNSPTYHKLWFSNIKETDTIPFFGLRKINQSPTKVLLFFDLWKYNYSISIGLLIMCFSFIVGYIIKNVNKLNKIRIIEIEAKDNDFTNKIFFLFFISLFLNMIA